MRCFYNATKSRYIRLRSAKRLDRGLLGTKIWDPGAEYGVDRFCDGGFEAWDREGFWQGGVEVRKDSRIESYGLGGLKDEEQDESRDGESDLTGEKGRHFK